MIYRPVLCPKHHIELQPVPSRGGERGKHKHHTLSRCPTCVAETKAKIKIEMQRRNGAGPNGQRKTLFEVLE